MNKIIFIIWLFIFTGFFCCKNDSIEPDEKKNATYNLYFNDDTTITNITGGWKLISYMDYTNDSLIEKDVEPLDGDVFIHFHDDTLFNGRVTVYPIWGAYEISDRKFHIRHLFQMKDQPWELWSIAFFDVVHSFDSFTINESQLKFYFDSGKKSANFLSTTYVDPWNF